ncbi:unnamed protein product [Eruca vesicaria subsp. sativa]|uniref:Selenoprotein H n=1 Tax=Eruca vesicaria subsp. sativa TaxID=29727 RepID=A0ABC8KF75_ERUVS|nr:unnamed protein product [Eruca vesicaria subsp. sativa]
MAPPKSTGGGGGDKGKSVATAATSTRQTRSMDRRTRSQSQARGGVNSASSKLFNFESPEKKKRKTKAKEGGAAATKKIKKEKEEAVVEEDDAAGEGEEDEDVSEQKTIVIEHCKQHKSFKERATEVKEGLEIAIPGIIVNVNPDKPRRGCFEIREEGGETFVSLLEMKKPFKEMTELDMEEVVADILKRIK